MFIRIPPPNKILHFREVLGKDIQLLLNKGSLSAFGFLKRLSIFYIPSTHFLLPFRNLFLLKKRGGPQVNTVVFTLLFFLQFSSHRIVLCPLTQRNTHQLRSTCGQLLNIGKLITADLPSRFKTTAPARK